MRTDIWLFLNLFPTQRKIFKLLQCRYIVMRHSITRAGLLILLTPWQGARNTCLSHRNRTFLCTLSIIWNPLFFPVMSILSWPNKLLTHISTLQRVGTGCQQMCKYPTRYCNIVGKGLCLHNFQMFSVYKYVIVFTSCYIYLFASTSLCSRESKYAMFIRFYYDYVYFR